AAADQGRGVHAFIVPTEDPHMSEYSPDSFKRREWVSRFTGTAGTAVILHDKALLWTDGRYFLQASQELGKEWTLMRAGTPGCPDIEEWLAANLPASARVGIDPYVHTVDMTRRLSKRMQESGKQVVALSEDNLVDKAWGSNRPAAPSAKLRVHPMKVWQILGVSKTDITNASSAALHLRIP
ncbi:Creatinase/Prolidase N-terminal domain-containing protein, partial [Dunaliella salina]